MKAIHSKQPTSLQIWDLIREVFGALFFRRILEAELKLNKNDNESLDQQLSRDQKWKHLVKMIEVYWEWRNTKLQVTVDQHKEITDEKVNEAYKKGQAEGKERA